jgi:hypothetical protein
VETRQGTLRISFLTIPVAHALALAKQRVTRCPDEMLNKTKPYMKDVEKHFDEWYKNSPEVRWTISAYALTSET